MWTSRFKHNQINPTPLICLPPRLVEFSTREGDVLATTPAKSKQAPPERSSTKSRPAPRVRAAAAVRHRGAPEAAAEGRACAGQPASTPAATSHLGPGAALARDQAVSAFIYFFHRKIMKQGGGRGRWERGARSGERERGGKQDRRERERERGNKSNKNANVK